MAGNLESMLMGESDDSSSDSDNELEEVTAGTVTTAASAVAASVQPVAPPVPAPPPAPVPAPAPAAPKAQSDLSARLKSLYSPASKSTPSSSRPVGGESGLPSAPNLSSPPSAARAPAPTNVPQQQQQPVPSPRQQQQQSQGSMYRPLVPNAAAKAPASMPKAVPRTADPFEPTPLRKMIEREQAKGSTSSSMPQTSTSTPTSQPQRRGAITSNVAPAPINRVASSGIQVPGIKHHPSASNVSTSSTASTVRAGNITPAMAAAQRVRQEQEAKRRKEKFLMFTRVLMKYLEQKDPGMHARAKAVIRECAEKNKNKEAGYESVTASMQTRLRATVGDAYWKRAESYLNHFLSQKKEKVEEAKRQQQKMMHEKQERERAAARQKIEQIEKEAAEAKRNKQSKQQKVEEAKARKRAKARETQAAKKLAAQQQAADKLAKQQREIAARRAALEAATGKTSAQQQAAAARMAADAKKSKKLTADKPRKSPTTATATVATTAPPEPKPEMPPREYSDLMEMVDFAVTYDWTSAGTLLGKDHKVDVNLNEEQNKLLYGEKSTPPVPGLVAASMAAGTLPSAPLPPALRGWSKRNVLSARSAWARIRLREQQERSKAAAAGGMPVVGGITLPGSAKPQVAKPQVANAAPGAVPSAAAAPPPAAPQAGAGAAAKVTPPAAAAVKVPPPRTESWFNDEKAEEDKTLALLSEATDMYLKTLLEKAIESARQRQNLDGIRLWHMQHSTKQKPPLSLRLGCDVTRQVAQAAGNAAKTTQRMEEALERQKHVPAKARALDEDETLFQATSMSDLAMRPKMASAASQADLNAKRSYEVYGGKHSGAPPFGRVPKKGKIVVRDFQSGMEHSVFPHQRTGIAASSFM